ncbi:hypothetical protein llap_16803 [Limosa lapponica baueri]|uniref:Uncharacterized protein n=1 Tax=Limosa lapponica baueri TaxID=1758121 RepID=A0A2I0TGG2_LIMLA|nr:hypothetical protein llap_16803 [Limosa lapponica baueri]
MQLDIILTSLQDHTHVASLLGYSSPSDATDTSSLCISYGNLSDQTYAVQSSHPDTHLAEILMKTLLRNLGFYTDQAFGELEKNSDKFLLGTSSSENSQPAHLHELLCSLQKQLLAYCHINSVSENSSSVALLHKHLQLLLPHATDIYSRSATLLKESSWNGSVGEKLRDVIYVSAAGSMLSQIVNSLLLLPVSVARPLLSYLLDLLPPLDRLNRLLPAAALLEDQELQWPLHGGPELIDPAGVPLPQPAQSWVWLVDLERTVALLIGRCLGGMLQGPPVSPEEQDTAYWLKTPLFSDGVEMDIPHLDKCMSSLLEVALSGNEEQKPFDYKLRPEISVYVDLALGCTKEPARSLWISMQDYAVSKAREVARSRDRDRMNTGTGTRLDDPPPQSQQERRISTDLTEGQDVYTAACNSVIHRCALLILGVSPVIEELQKRREDGQLQQPPSTTPEGIGLMTRSLGVHTLIENVVSFVSGDVGNSPGFKEPEESMSTSPQASIIAMEQQQLRAEPVDVSLAISTGLLNVLSQLCGTDTMLGQPLQLLPKTGISQLSTALKVASTRLLQILAITTGTYADKLSPKVVQSLLDLLCSQLKNLLSQAGVMLMASFGEGEGEEDEVESKKTDANGDNEKRDFRAALRKQHAAELHLGDFLVFLRRVVSSKAIQSKMASPKWTEVLLNIASQKCCSGVPLVGNLRTRLLALHVLEAVLPACESGVEDDQMAQVVERLFSLLSDCMWETPIAQAKHAIQIKEKEQEMKLQKQGESEDEDENLPIQEVSFDPEKAQCCIVENGQILTHGSGGKGYGLASTGVTSGCYQWKEPKLAFEDVDAAELYPCVMFYSSNPGEKVKICDMQMRGTPRDLLPGDPICSPVAAVLAEATIQLIRILHRTDRWTHCINKKMMERLNKIKTCLKEAGQKLKKSRSIQSREENEVREEKESKEEEKSKHSRHGLADLSELQLKMLCVEVWPVLAVIGGVDAGLRVGGRCVHKQTGRHATLLGVVKEGSTSAKVQWDEAEITISDTPLYNLEPCEPLPFDVARFRGLTATVLLDLTYLTGIHEDMGKQSTKRHEKKHRRESEDKGEMDQKTEGDAGSDTRLGQSADDNKGHSATSSKSENEIASFSLEPSTLGMESQHQPAEGRKKNHEHTPRNHDIVQSEIRAVQLSYLYLGAMKSLSVLLSCSKYAELLLIPKVLAENGHNSDCASSPVVHEDVEMRAALQFLMRHMVKRAVMRSPIKRALGLADLERAQAMIYKLVVHGLLEDQFGGKLKQVVIA